MGLPLRKKESLPLRKPDGQALTQVKMGLGWDPIQKEIKSSGFFGMFSSVQVVEQSVDFDASVIAYRNGQLVDIVYFGKKSGLNNAIRHSGDNLTGNGDGDDEVIVCDLDSVAKQGVTDLFFVINSFSGQKFSDVKNAFCRVVDAVTDQEHSRFELSDGQPVTAYVMTRIQRADDTWKIIGVGAEASARTAKELEPFVRSLL